MSLLKYLTIFLLINSCYLLGQDTTKFKLSISSASVGIGYLTNSVENGKLQEFNYFAPNSILLKNEYSNFAPSEFSSVRVLPYYTSQIGIQGFDVKNLTLNLGFSLVPRQNLSGYLHKIENHPYDTLTSSQTGNQIFIDSVVFSSLNMDQFSEELRLDAAYVYTVNQDSLFSFGVGVGGGFGFVYNSRTTLSYHESYFISSYSSNPSGSITYDTETIRNKGYVTSFLYFPIFFNFGLSKSHPFWKRIQLYTEVRPSVIYYSIPEWKQNLKFNLMQSFGLRVRW